MFLNETQVERRFEALWNEKMDAFFKTNDLTKIIQKTVQQEMNALLREEGIQQRLSELAVNVRSVVASQANSAEFLARVVERLRAVQLGPQ